MLVGQAVCSLLGLWVQRPDGKFGAENRYTEYGAVCNNCVGHLYSQRQKDEAAAAAAKKKQEEEVAAKLAEETAKR